MLLIVYVSAATRLLTQPELLALLKISRENNARRGITGVLLYNDGNFIQAFEGPDEVVRELHQQIQNDPRHQYMRTVLEEHVSERQFEQWSMGFVPTEHLSAEDHAAFTHFLLEPQSLEVGGTMGKTVRTALEMFHEHIR
jgi:hypothetical protein